MSTVNSQDKILIVDDEHYIAEVVARKLHMEGYTCETSDSANDALSRIHEGSFALVITDIRMPGMDGLELTQQLKQTHPDLGIIIMTVITDAESAVTAMKLGADDYITKPFNLDEITISTEKALERRNLKIENRDYQLHLEERVKESTKELQETLTKLRETTDYLANLMDSSADAIICTDRQGIITLASKGAERTIGFKVEELAGTAAHNYYGGGEEEAKRIATRLSASEGRLQSYETELIGKDGGEIPVSLSISTLRNDKGEAIGIVSIARNITDRKKLEEELKDLSIRDSLTRLYNQRHFYEKLEQEMARAKRQSHPLSLVLFDIDNFKQYNDNSGHIAGDEVLENVGEIVRECTREHVDSGFRYGGDEFTVILSETNEEQAAGIAERIRKSFKDLRIAGLTLSMGVMHYDGEQDIKSITRWADKMMYEAKHAGGNRVILYGTHVLGGRKETEG